jgi:hypothetical protein
MLSDVKPSLSEWSWLPNAIGVYLRRTSIVAAASAASSRLPECADRYNSPLDGTRCQLPGRLKHALRFLARLLPDGAAFAKKLIAAIIDAFAHDRRLGAPIDPNCDETNQEHDASNDAKDDANLEMLV